MNALETYDLEKDGQKYRVEIVYDEHGGPPWDEHDGHGTVRITSNQIYGPRPKKLPGERVLHAGRHETWFYDFRGATHLALIEQWGVEDPTGKTPRQIAAEAAERDFEYLRGWLKDDWHWVGVAVFPLTEDGDELRSKTESLWGIESNAEEYLKEVALDLVGSIIFPRSTLELQTT